LFVFGNAARDRRVRIYFMGLGGWFMGWFMGCFMGGGNDR
jgi:hypothetical protein